MYNRRDQLCGGPDQAGNGLEMWRRLYMEFEGGSELVAYGGRKGFNRYPRCTKVAELHQHLDDWVDCLLQYGKDLLNNPRELDHRCLEIIPHELEDEIVMKGDEIKTYQQIVDFCKRRTTHLKYKALSRHAEKGPGARHMNVLKPESGDVSMASTYTQAQLDQIIAAVKVGCTDKRSTKGGGKGTSSPRGRSPGGRDSAPPRFSFPNDQ